MNTQEWNNAKVGQIIRGERIKAVRKDQFGVSGIITKKGDTIAVYSAPNTAPDEAFTDTNSTSARLGVILESF